jgi:protein-disulfide isomerase
MTLIHEHPNAETLMAWADHELSEVTMSEVARHIDGCSACAATIGEFQSLHRRLSTWTVDPATLSRPLIRTKISRRIVIATAFAAVAVLLFLVAKTVMRDTTSGLAGSGANGTGAANALNRVSEPVTVTVFMDWQCPACLTSYPAYVAAVAQANKRQPGSVVLSFKDYPLDASCNPNVEAAHHPAACEAAAAVRMARAHGKADEMIAAFVARGQQGTASTLTNAEVEQTARQILGPIDFGKEAAAVRNELAGDIQDAAALKLSYVPAIVVNGRLVNAETSLASALNEALGNRR